MTRRAATFTTLDDAFDAPDPRDMVRPDSAPDPDEAPWGLFDGPEDGCAFHEPGHTRRARRRQLRDLWREFAI